MMTGPKMEGKLGQTGNHPDIIDGCQIYVGFATRHSVGNCVRHYYLIIPSVLVAVFGMDFDDDKWNASISKPSKAGRKFVRVKLKMI